MLLLLLQSGRGGWQIPIRVLKPCYCDCYYYESLYFDTTDSQTFDTEFGNSNLTTNTTATPTPTLVSAMIVLKGFPYAALVAKARLLQSLLVLLQ